MSAPNAYPAGITIVLPVFFKAPSSSVLAQLITAVDSVLANTAELPFEILIVDDGCRPALVEMPELSNMLNNDNVRCVRIPQNLGLVNALNVGLSRARYSWIGRIDADDVWAPGKLEKQIQLIRDDPALTIVGTGMVTIDETGAEKDVYIRPVNWGGLLEFIASTGCPFPHGSILARRDVFLELGGYSHDPEVRHCEDFDLWCTWLRFFKGATVPQPLYRYTLSQGQISATHAELQRARSGAVHARFLSLHSREHLPYAIETLASRYSLTPLDCGRLMYRVWKYFRYVVADEQDLHLLRTILSDRDVVAPKDVPNLSIEACAWIGGEVPLDLSHLRLVACISDLLT